MQKIAPATVEYLADIKGQPMGIIIPMGGDTLYCTLLQPLSVVAHIVAFNRPVHFA